VCAASIWGIDRFAVDLVAIDRKESDFDGRALDRSKIDR